MVTGTCRLCHNWSSWWLDLDQRWLDSQRDGNCKYCEILAAIVSPHISDGKFSLTMMSSPGRRPLIQLRANGNLHTLLDIYLDHESEEFELVPFCPTSPYSRSDSDECFKFLRVCLEECLSSHQSCTPLSSPPNLPKRILKIQNGGTWPPPSHEKVLRLCEDEVDRAHYVALSHCWGNYQPLRALLSTRQSLKEGIPFSQLSAVFQDAIQVCLHMKIDYLWIDSLCIIQNDEKDWEKESAKMCDYYENAIFTISASSSRDGSVPFLRQRSEVWRPQYFQYIESSGRPINVISQRIALTGGYLSTTRQAIEDGDVLATRAWTFQEGLLSKRVLYYTGAKLFWACRSSKMEEDKRQPSINSADQLCSRELSSLGKDANKLWRSLISQFSSRDLTYPTDCLPALSGVATKFERQLNWEYVAGLWKEDLPLSLTWAVSRRKDDPTPPRSMHSEYIAPSWSWASVGQSIYFPGILDYYNSERFMTVEEVHCKPAGLNALGRVASGQLVLRGIIFEISLSQQHLSRPVLTPGFQLGNSPDLLTQFMEDCLLVRSGSTLRRGRPDARFEPYSDITVLCILLGMDINPEQTEGPNFHALLLGDSGKEAVYERLGLGLFEQSDIFYRGTKAIVRIE
ncbi:heterokaryon incompatibility protein-domain-containing protein [Hypoxylon argillaceum]|nr:heterokaryon incompatibility protein-domain-containing protein [Hypoxylon argillaceum]